MFWLAHDRRRSSLTLGLPLEVIVSLFPSMQDLDSLRRTILDIPGTKGAYAEVKKGN